MKIDLLIIGGGPSGITLAEELGQKKKVGVIRPEDHFSGATDAPGDYEFGSSRQSQRLILS